MSRELGKYAADLGLEIALELEPFKLSLVNNVDSMVPLPRRGEPSGRAGEHRRVAPAAVGHDRPEELRRLKGKATHVHLSDCDGKVHGDLPPGRGVVDFAPYLREIKALGIDGAVSIELEYSPRAGEDRGMGARGVSGDGRADAAGGIARLTRLHLVLPLPRRSFYNCRSLPTVTKGSSCRWTGLRSSNWCGVAGVSIDDTHSARWRRPWFDAGVGRRPRIAGRKRAHDRRQHTAAALRFPRSNERIRRFETPGDDYRDIEAAIVLDTGTWNQLGDYGKFLQTLGAEARHRPSYDAG